MEKLNDLRLSLDRLNVVRNNLTEATYNFFQASEKFNKSLLKLQLALEAGVGRGILNGSL